MGVVVVVLLLSVGERALVRGGVEKGCDDGWGEWGSSRMDRGDGTSWGGSIALLQTVFTGMRNRIRASADAGYAAGKNCISCPMSLSLEQKTKERNGPASF